MHAAPPSESLDAIDTLDHLRHTRDEARRRSANDKHHRLLRAQRAIHNTAKRTQSASRRERRSRASNPFHSLTIAMQHSRDTSHHFTSRDWNDDNNDDDECHSGHVSIADTHSEEHIEDEQSRVLTLRDFAHLTTCTDSTNRAESKKQTLSLSDGVSRGLVDNGNDGDSFIDSESEHRSDQLSEPPPVMPSLSSPSLSAITMIPRQQRNETTVIPLSLPPTVTNSVSGTSHSKAFIVTPYDDPMNDNDRFLNHPSHPTFSRNSSLASLAPPPLSLASLDTSQLRLTLLERLKSMADVDLRTVAEAVDRLDRDHRDRQHDEMIRATVHFADNNTDEERSTSIDGSASERKRTVEPSNTQSKKKHRRRSLHRVNDRSVVSPTNTNSDHDDGQTVLSHLSSPEHHRDWNEEFQRLLSIVHDDDTILDHQQSFQELSELAADFAFAARAIGKIIIAEKYLDVKDKTIKPVNIGGIAGGEKYVVQNIVFKFQVDHLSLYGGDENAMIAGNHELLGLSAYYRAIAAHKDIGVSVPLACLIDYLGFRLWCVSSLPVSKKTLVLGSNDGGQHIVNHDPNVSQALQRLAEVLNLKPHYVSDRSGKRTLLFAPFDLECHRGADGRVYLLDFHRVFSAEPPSLIQTHLPQPLRNPHLYRLLRPELVRSNPVPLSSDAFIGNEMTASESQRQCNEEVNDAYHRLMNKVIPRFAHQLDQIECIERIKSLSTMHQRGIEAWLRAKSMAMTHSNPSSLNVTVSENLSPCEEPPSPSPSNFEGSPPVSPLPSPSPGSRQVSAVPDTNTSTNTGSSTDFIAYSPLLCAYVHQAGINLRHLGVVRRHVKSPSISDVLLVEILARVLKSEMRRRWREQMSASKHISDGVYRRCTVQFVNLVFHNTQQSTHYWNTIIKQQIQQKFYSSLTEEEKSESFDLKGSLLVNYYYHSGSDDASGSVSISRANSEDHPLVVSSPYRTVSLHERRLSAILNPTRTVSVDSVTSSAEASGMPRNNSNPSLTSPPASAPSIIRSQSLAPRRDLLRLVFLRFIHLTGIILETEVLSADCGLYNERQAPHTQANSRRRRMSQSGATPALSAQSSMTSDRSSVASINTMSLQRSISTNSLMRSSATKPVAFNNHRHSLSLLSSSQPLSAQPANHSASHRGTPRQSSFPSTSITGSQSPSFLFYDRPIEDIHIKVLEDQVKSLNIVSYAEGTALLCKCISKDRREDGASVDDSPNTTLAAYLSDLAESKFRESLKRTVDDCLTLCNYSMLYSLYYKDMDNAKNLLLSAIHVNRKHHRSFYYLAQLFQYDVKDFRMAESLYLQALSLNPSHVNTLKDYANLLYHQSRDYVRAENYLRQAISHKPNHIKALHALGKALARKAKTLAEFDGVVQCYRDAAQSNYGEAVARSQALRRYMSLLTVKGQLHYERGELDLAFRCFKEGLAHINPVLEPYQIAQTPEPNVKDNQPRIALRAVYAQFLTRIKQYSDAKAMWLSAVMLSLGFDCVEQLLAAQQKELSKAPFNRPASKSIASNTAVVIPAPLITAAPVSAFSTSSPSSSLPIPVTPAANSAPLPVWSAPAVSALTSAMKWKKQQPQSQSLHSKHALLPAAHEAQSLATPTTANTNLGEKKSPRIEPIAATTSHSLCSSLASTPSNSTSVIPSVPWSLTLSSSPPVAQTTSVWTQRRQWVPDQPYVHTSNSISGKKLNDYNITGKANAGKPGIPNQSTLQSTVSSASVSPVQRPGSANSLRSASPASVSPHPTPAAVPVFEPRVELSLTHIPPTTAAMPSELPTESTRPAVAEPFTISQSTTNTPLTKPPLGRTVTDEAALRAEEARLESNCPDTTIVRLYADYLRYHHPHAIEESEHWYLFAIALCPYGRRGSMNLASYADYLGRVQHRQFEAEQAFHQSLHSPLPSPEAFIKYSLYLKEILDADHVRCQSLNERGQSLKKELRVHECHRMRKPGHWYCDGQACKTEILKSMIEIVNQDIWAKKQARKANRSKALAQQQPQQHQFQYPHGRRQSMAQLTSNTINGGTAVVATISPLSSTSTITSAPAPAPPLPAAVPVSTNPFAPLATVAPAPAPGTSGLTSLQAGKSWSSVLTPAAAHNGSAGATPSPLPSFMFAAASHSPAATSTGSNPMNSKSPVTALPSFVPRSRPAPVTSIASSAASAPHPATLPQPFISSPSRQH